MLENHFAPWSIYIWVKFMLQNRNILLALGILIVGCGGSKTSLNVDNNLSSANHTVEQKNAPSKLTIHKAAETGVSTETIPIYTYKIKHAWPHDKQAFTQGLIYQDGILWESTGQYGSSSLRKVELKTGRVLQKISVPEEYFAEGMTLFRGKVFQLTWQSQRGFIYDPTTFQKLGEFVYNNEGWGLTHDGESLIMSDGTNQIRYLDPTTFQTTRKVSIFERGTPVMRLNELEFIRGEIYANIWETNRIVRIDPKSGKILAWIDLTGLLGDKERTGAEDVLNGIAYDEKGQRLFVTGKLWPKLFEIELVKK